MSFIIHRFHRLKYQRSPTSGCRDIGIKNQKFLDKNWVPWLNFAFCILLNRTGLKFKIVLTAFSLSLILFTPSLIISYFTSVFNILYGPPPPPPTHRKSINSWQCWMLISPLIHWSMKIFLKKGNWAEM